MYAPLLPSYIEAFLPSKALHEIHSKGVVHGDISLGNVLFDKATGKLMLIDFGSAALTGVEWQKPAPYSLDYVAPERRERIGNYHPLSDVYSAGALFRHLVSRSYSCGYISTHLYS
jgi:eukaryotic-like serine/threonine-protein kinase